MIVIGKAQGAALLDDKIGRDARCLVASLTDIAAQRGMRDSATLARGWLIDAIHVAKRHGIADLGEIGVLALIVADLGAAFDLDAGNELLSELLAADPLSGASTVAELVSSRLADRHR